MTDVTIDNVAGFARPALAARFNVRRLLFSGMVALAAIGAATYGFEWWTAGRFIESTDDAYVGGDVTAIAPHVAGFVSQIAVTDNQHIRKGDVLLRLDDRDFRAAEDHASATVSEQQAALANLQARRVLQQSLIGEAEADLASRQAAATFARQDALRYHGLMKAAAKTEQDVQRAAVTDLQAQSAVISARASVAAARQQVAVITSEIDQARAAVAQAEADLRTARLNLGYTIIRSPVDGYVGNRAVHVGVYVAAGAYLASIIPSRGLWVDANFKEDQLARLHPGQKVRVEADVLPGQTFTGEVASLAPATGAQFSVLPPENATGNFTKIVQRVPVRIVLNGTATELGRLRPGLSVTAHVDTHDR
jgi:membrane fusion protein (multidrug efflux system)